jgi:Fe-S cluster biogenesis protein NfuA
MRHMDNSEFQAHTGQIDRLVQRVTALPDGDARSTALDLLQSMMDLHGAVVSRIVEVLSEGGESSRSALSKLGADPLICGLLVLYGVHPLSLEERVKRAIEKVRPQITKKGATVELLDVNDTAVRLRLDGAGHGCGSSPDALKSAVEQAILEAAPEVVEIVTEGLPSSSSGFVAINMIQSATKEGKYEESTA